MRWGQASRSLSTSHTRCCGASISTDFSKRMSGAHERRGHTGRLRGGTLRRRWTETCTDGRGCSPSHHYGRLMITRTLALAAVSAVVLSASAWAAETGSYSGTSVNKEIYLYGDIEPRTDKGKVTFAVSSRAVKNFKLKAQQVMCGATTAEIPVAVAKIKLNASGRGKGTYTNSSVGAF